MEKALAINNPGNFDTNKIAIAKKIATGDMYILDKERVKKRLENYANPCEWNEVLSEVYPKLKMFLDIEKEIEKEDYEEYKDIIPNELSEKIDHIAEILGCKVHVSYRHRISTKNNNHFKFSFHAIYEVYFKSTKHMLQWLINQGYVQENKEDCNVKVKLKSTKLSPKIDEKNWIDVSNYQPHHKFTMIHTVKNIKEGDKEPWKILYDDSNTEDFFITDINCNFPIIDVEIKEETKSKKKYQSASKLVTKANLKVYEKYFIGFQIIGIKDNSILVLKSNTEKTYCPCCDKTHEHHQNFYGLISKEGNVMFRCHSSKKQIKMGDVKMCEYLSPIKYDSEEINTTDLNKYYMKINEDNDIPKEKLNPDKSYSPAQKITKSLNSKVLLIHSNTGTGKSQFIYNQIRNYESCLSIVSRCSLAYEHKKNMKEFVDYKDINGKIDASKCIICLNSLDRIKPNTFYDCVIMDEINSIINHLCSVTIESIAIIYSRLFMILQNAKKVICADADITDLTVAFLNSIFKLHEIKYIRNTNVRKREQICKYYVGKKGEFNYAEIEFYKELKKAYLNNEKLYIGCDRKRDVEHIHAFLNSLSKNKTSITNMTSPEDLNEIKVYTSSEGDLYDIISDKIPHVMIVSPRISYGISLTNPKYFDKVFGLYRNLSINVQEILQQISRYRIDVPNFIYSEENHKVPRFWNYKQAENYFKEIINLVPTLNFDIKVGYNSYFSKIPNDINNSFVKSHKIIKPELSLDEKSIFNKLKIFIELYNEKSKQNPSKLLMENLIAYKGFNIELHTNESYKAQESNLKHIGSDEAKRTRAISFINNNLDKSSLTNMNEENIKFWMNLDDVKEQKEEIKINQLKLFNEKPDERFETCEGKIRRIFRDYYKQTFELKGKKKENIDDKIKRKSKVFIESYKNIKYVTNNGKLNIKKEIIIDEKEYNRTYNKFIEKYGIFIRFFNIKEDIINMENIIYIAKIIKHKEDIIFYMMNLQDKNNELIKNITKKYGQKEFDNEMTMIKSIETKYITYKKMCDAVGCEIFGPIDETKKDKFAPINSKLIYEAFERKIPETYDNYKMFITKYKERLMTNLGLEKSKQLRVKGESQFRIRMRVPDEKNLKIFSELFCN